MTVLATLRYRLEPRLAAAGIAVVWQVSELPDLLPLSPEAVLQVERIAMEAFTDVLKHARATRVIVETFRRSQPAAAVLRIVDDGIGLREGREVTAGAGGRGWSGMRRRAEAIGASIRFESGTTRSVDLAGVALGGGLTLRGDCALSEVRAATTPYA